MGSFDLTTLDGAALSVIREASNDLFKYVTFLSKNKILESASVIRGDNGELGQFVEILLGNTQSIPLWGNTIIEETRGKTSIRAVEVVNSELTQHNTNKSFGLATTDKNVFTSRKPITVFAHGYDRVVDVSNTNSDLSALFLSVVPPIEMSLCVPYVDIQFILPVIFDVATGGETTTFTESTNRSMTLAGYYGTTGKQFQAPDSKIQTTNSSKVKFPSYVSGMEMFQSPQTMNLSYSDILTKSSLNGVPILDPLLPPASLKSLSIEQIGLGGGAALAAETRIEMKVTVHDKSRLAELEPIISASTFPTTSIRITWGWSHPDKNMFSNNKFAKFINAMRYTQDFIVSKVSISSGQSTNIDLGISLVAAGSFNAKNAPLGAARGTRVPISILKSYISDVEKYFSKLNASKAKADSEGTAVVDKKDNSGKFIDYIAFEKFKTDVSDIMASRNLTGLKTIIDEFNKEIDDEKITAISKFTEEFKYIRTLAPVDKYKLDTIYSDFSNFSIGETTINNSAAVKNSVDVLSKNTAAPTLANNTMPLYSAIIRFVASPLATCLDGIDEVRIHLMSFNGAAGYFACENIGMFPIDIDKFNLEKDISTATASSMMSNIADQASTTNSPYFGYNVIYENNKLDSAETDEANLEAASKKLSTELEAQSQKIYEAISGNISGLVPTGFEFTPPNIKYKIEIVPAYNADENKAAPDIADSNKKILRITVYDDAGTGSFQEGATMLSLSRTAGVAMIIDPGPIAKAEGLVELRDEPDGKKIIELSKDKKLLRKYFTTLFPTIVIGGESSLITSTQFSSAASGDLQSSYILRAYESAGIPMSKDSGSTMAQDIDILPMSLTISMIGNPLITRGQVYYVDFGTGTTLDNAYIVQKVSHTIEGGAFKTSVTMGPTSQATMRSASTKINALFGIKAKTVTAARP